MFQLDDDFLKDLGVAALPDEEKKVLLLHIYEELEMRVGGKLAEGLSEDQMAEFDAILQREEGKIRQWLQTNLPDYHQQEEYQTFMTNAQQDANNPDPAVLSQYVATKWLEKNRPHYRDVVSATLQELKDEIIGSRDAILGAAA